jgi:hypothetical protein
MRREMEVVTRIRIEKVDNGYICYVGHGPDDVLGNVVQSSHTIVAESFESLIEALRDQFYPPLSPSEE